MIIKTIVTDPIETNCYVVTCEDTKETVIIDPGLDNGAVVRHVKNVGGQV